MIEGRNVNHNQRFLFFLLAIALSGALFAVRDRAPERGVTVAAAALPESEPASRAGVVIDDRRQQLIGVRTARVARGTLARTIHAAGSVRYDETRLTDVNLKLDGWINELHVNYVGQTVARDQSLFTLSSPELQAAQNDFIAALRNREQVTTSQAADAREFGARLVDAPRQRLLRWDVPEDQLRAIEENRQVHPALVFRSPVAGVVVEKTVLNGMHVAAGQSLYRIADLSVVWIDADFLELDLSALRVGATASVTTDAWPGQQLSGQIVHVYPYLTEQTRTVKARIALANREGRLKPGMFANVDVTVTSGEGLLVPADAVVDSGTRQIVFVAQGAGRFEPRNVTVGARTDERALIVAGLHEHDEVATRATFFLDSESQMRAALQHYQTAPSHEGASEEPVRFDLGVQTSPNPPRAGENMVEVRLRDAEARPVTDTDIRVLFSMAPMPSMNMPAMRSEARLTHVGNGVYRGPATLSMTGRWDVTVSALRRGRSLAETRTSLVAR